MGRDDFYPPLVWIYLKTADDVIIVRSREFNKTL